MKALEFTSKTDKKGHLKLDLKLERSNGKVRVIVLIEEGKDESDEEQLWLRSISTNPAFDFLNAAEEDIYSLTDGEPFNG